MHRSRLSSHDLPLQPRPVSRSTRPDSHDRAGRAATSPQPRRRPCGASRSTRELELIRRAPLARLGAFLFAPLPSWGGAVLCQVSMAISGTCMRAGGTRGALSAVLLRQQRRGTAVQGSVQDAPHRAPLPPGVSAFLLSSCEHRGVYAKRHLNHECT